jgi:hypothetical protein
VVGERARAFEKNKLKMESVAEKKEIENNNNSNGDNAQPILDSSSSSPLSATADYTNAYNNNNKEARDFRERQAHDLKAGLHPLKVFLSHSLFLSLHTHTHNIHTLQMNFFWCFWVVSDMICDCKICLRRPRIVSINARFMRNSKLYD